MINISGVIITYNEEKHIEKCLSSLQGIVDEIIVVDSFSNDRTPEICKKYNVSFIQKEFLGYIEQKNFALSKTSNNIVLSLDGDESLSNELGSRILEIKKDWKKDGYYINRHNFFCGKWINHGNWYPDKKLRLFDKTKGKWEGINPHDSFKLVKTSSIGRIRENILHWTHDSYTDFSKKMEHFSSISARSYFELGIKAPIWKIYLKPFWGFIKSYIFRFGFMDGLDGFIISVVRGYLTFLKYIKLRELILKEEKEQYEVKRFSKLKGIEVE